MSQQLESRLILEVKIDRCDLLDMNPVEGVEGDEA